VIGCANQLDCKIFSTIELLAQNFFANPVENLILGPLAGTNNHKNYESVKFSQTIQNSTNYTV